MKIKVLVFDTETTGLPLKNIPAKEDLGNYPTVLQFAGSFFEVDLDKLQDDNYGVVRDIFNINSYVQPYRKDVKTVTHPKALKVHGITDEIAETGNLIETVALLYQGLAIQADVIVAHNLDFDSNVMMSEMLNLGLVLGTRKTLCTICTMEFAKPILKLPNESQYAREEYKNPNLGELYQYLFDENLEDNHLAHDADGDVAATRRVFLELLKTEEVLESFIRDKRKPPLT
jgi:DNA polymerase III epsilon subunit-like protein